MSLPLDSKEVLERFHGELPLVEIVARQVLKKLSRNADLEELLSAGREGLLMAARRFDPGRGVPFRAYANYRVQGAIYDALRKQLPLSRREHAKVKAAEAALELGRGQLGWQASGEGSQIQAEENLEEHLAAVATAAAIRIVSDSQIAELAAPDDVEGQYQESELLDLIRRELGALGPEESEIVRRYYFEGQAFTDIARELRISKAWTSRLHARAMSRLTLRLKGTVERPSLQN